MQPPRRAWALLHAEDDSLSHLLGDVFAELGMEHSPRAAENAQLVLVHVEGREGLGHLERAVRSHSARARVVALLPFADDRMTRASTLRGARGVYALGTPLEHLKTLVSEGLAG